MKFSFKKTWMMIPTLLALMLSVVGVAPAYAANFTVTNLNNSGAGSLRQAITNANAATGADTITFNVSGTITLLSTLPTINDPLTLNGVGQKVIISGGHAVRVLMVATSLTLNHVTVANGNPSAGAVGGGILNAGTLNIINNPHFWEQRQRSQWRRRL